MSYDIKFNATPPALSDGQVTDFQADAAGRLKVATAAEPTTAAASAVAPVVTAAVASSKVLKAAPGNFYGCNVVSGASGGYVMLHDAVAAPADGAVTPIKCWVLAANSSLEVGYAAPIRCAVGITIAFSTTGPFAQALSATAFISGDAV